MASAYTKVAFTDSAKGITATKLNLLRDDLSAAIGSGSGGGGTGDMTKAVYDTNNNGVVDTCDALAWSKLTGVPTTFPPTVHAPSHNLGGSDPIAPDWTQVQNKPATFPPTPGPPQAHQASHVSGTDQIPSASTSVRGLMPIGNGNPNAFYGSDGTQKAVSYTMLAGSQPGPVAHAASHLDNGPDPIAVVTSSRTGLTPKLSGSAATYLDGTGAFSTPAGSGVPVPGFISKSAAYTLTTADSSKYVVCSGGSWTLTLPAPVVGLIYQVRNDQGISGTTGTITLQPTGGTIDGLASKPLLPQQECTLLTDGTNWRTFGLKREVILGTQDITSSTAFGSVLLPVGYRYFELEFTGLAPTTSDYLSAQLSINGGSTWLAASYYWGMINNSSPTALTYQDGENVAYVFLCITSVMAVGKLILYPGSATVSPCWTVDFGGRNTVAYQIKANGTGLIAPTPGQVNALKYNFGANNIAQCFLTVKGVV